MGVAIPDRRGWLEEALQASSPVPPFPDFTAFERAALEALAGQFGPDAAAFQAQVDAAQVVDRVNTTIGFYTRLQVDPARAAPLKLPVRGAQFEAEGVPFGVGAALWAKGGWLETIEAFTYGDVRLDGNLSALKFVRLVQVR